MEWLGPESVPIPDISDPFRLLWLHRAATRRPDES